MMEFIAAIELGSSKITGMVGKKNSDESMQILAYAKEEVSASVRRGTVYNLNKTAQALTSVINRLEGKLQCSIGKVYVGISGVSLHTVSNEILRRTDKNIIVSESLVHSVIDENYGAKLPDMDILDVVPQEYEVGNSFQVDPVGVECNHIKGRFLNIVARSSVKKKLEDSFKLAKLDIADILIAPLTTARVLLTESEMRSGCALIDFGADTTTISIYKDKILRFLTVLPIGGNSITRDIASLQVEEDEAERMKIRYGNAVFEENEKERDATYVTENKARAVKLNDLNDIVEARTEEIIANVWNQIKQSGYEDRLISGLVITGGGSNLRNIDEALRRKEPQFRIRPAHFIFNEVHDADDKVLLKDGTQNTLLGLLFAGTENCCRQVVAEKEPTPKDLFTDDESLKNREKEAEKLKKQKEEDENKKKKPKKSEKNWFSGKIKELTKDIFEDEPVK